MNTPISIFFASKRIRIPLLLIAILAIGTLLRFKTVGTPVEKDVSISDKFVSQQPGNNIQKTKNMVFVPANRRKQTPGIDTTLPRKLLSEKGIYFGTYLSYEDAKQWPPHPKNFLSTIGKYFTLYSIPAWYDHVETAQGVFNFANPDGVADFAVAQGAKIQAHNLVWHGSLPAWLVNGHYTPDQLASILKNHIQTVMRHYKDKYPGRVIAWDVVNESMSDSENLDPGLSYPDGLRKNIPIWNAIHKPGSTDPTDYIQLAFEWAHEADPSAVLYWNEFNVEYKGFKMNRWFNIIKSLKQKGVPIGGAGFQSHLILGYAHPKEDLLENMNRFADIGIQSEVTEMDVMMSYADWSNPPFPHPKNINPTQAEFVRQANLYKSFLDVCIKAKNCNAFITQSCWDNNTWPDQKWKDASGHKEGPFYPGLFDVNFNPKKSLYALFDEMKEQL